MTKALKEAPEIVVATPVESCQQSTLSVNISTCNESTHL